MVVNSCFEGLEGRMGLKRVREFIPKDIAIIKVWSIQVEYITGRIYFVKFVNVLLIIPSIWFVFSAATFFLYT